MPRQNSIRSELAPYPSIHRQGELLHSRPATCAHFYLMLVSIFGFTSSAVWDDRIAGMGEKRPDDPVLFAMNNTKTLLMQHGAYSGDAGRRHQESQLPSPVLRPEWHEAPVNLSQATGFRLRIYNVRFTAYNLQPVFV